MWCMVYCRGDVVYIGVVDFVVVFVEGVVDDVWVVVVCWFEEGCV